MTAKQDLQVYKCPNCGLLLEFIGISWKCAAGHCFDVAKEGYVNLILANRKKSLISGDSKEMILAREEFLQKGIYGFLIGEMVGLWRGFVNGERGRLGKDGGGLRNILEIGCGSGYYLNGLAEPSGAVEVFGSDVSKEAIKFCAKKYGKYNFSVDNSFDLNFVNGYFDLVFSVFSPFKSSEVERVLAERGLFILIRPNKHHLRELYEVVGLDPKDKNEVSFERLRLIESRDLLKKVTMSTEELELLIKMSPLNWTTEKMAFNLNRLKNIPITLDFKVSVYGF